MLMVNSKGMLREASGNQDSEMRSRVKYLLPGVGSWGVGMGRKHNSVLEFSFESLGMAEVLRECGLQLQQVRETEKEMWGQQLHKHTGDFSEGAKLNSSFFIFSSVSLFFSLSLSFCCCWYYLRQILYARRKYLTTTSYIFTQEEITLESQVTCIS